MRKCHKIELYLQLPTNRKSHMIYRTAQFSMTLNGSKRRALTAASVVRCLHKTTTKCLWRARRYTPETKGGQTPLVITPVFCSVWRRRTEPGGYFLLKTGTLPYSWPYPTHEAGPDPNRPTNGSKQGGLWPRGCLSVGVWSEIIGDRDNRRH